MKGLYSVALFLSSLIFDIAIYGLILRLSLQFFQVSRHNPVSEMIAKITDFAVIPLRRLLPSVRFIDVATLTLLLIVLMLKMTLLPLFFIGTVLPFLAICFYTLVGMVVYPCKFFFFAILIRVILSWVSPGYSNPLVQVLYPITEPLLRIGRKILPDISGIDFSPFIISILLLMIPLFMTAYVPAALF